LFFQRVPDGPNFVKSEVPMENQFGDFFFEVSMSIITQFRHFGYGNPMHLSLLDASLPGASGWVVGGLSKDRKTRDAKYGTPDQGEEDLIKRNISSCSEEA
jgi:hypothetical protein